MLAAALSAPAVAAAEPAAERPDHPAVAAIRFYQKHLSALRHGRCRFAPSCSRFAAEAIQTYGLAAGAARAADRLVRCTRSAARFHPRTADGRLSDPVGGGTRGALSPAIPPWLLPDPAPATPPPAAAEAPPEAWKGRTRALEDAAFAGSLVLEGDCERAATEYRRAAHAAGDPAFDAWSRERVGLCRFEASEWAPAEREFVAAGMLAAGDGERRRASGWAAACRFNSADFAGCAAILEAGVRPPDLADAGPGPGPGAAAAGSPGDRARIHGLLGLCAMASGDWSGAAGSFRRGLEADGGGPLARRLARLSVAAGEGAFLPRRRAWLAAALSAAVPGAGQVYAGRSSEGFRHLFFNGALLYSIAKLARDGHYPAAAALAGLEIPFYAGNVIGARNAAISHNRAARMVLLGRCVATAQP